MSDGVLAIFILLKIKLPLLLFKLRLQLFSLGKEKLKKNIGGVLCKPLLGLEVKDLNLLLMMVVMLPCY
jgi:hypothetical protein